MVDLSIGPSAANRYSSSRNYRTAERMDILRSAEGPGFLPVTKREVDVAFLRWWHSQHGGELLNTTLARIFFSQNDLPAGKPEGAVKAVVGEQAAYLRQAGRDLAVLMRAARAAFANPIAEDSTMTAADYFSGVPAHDGPGQLVRFIDLGRIADGVGPGSFSFNPLSGEVQQGKISGTRGVVDPYTVVQPTREVHEHIEEVLSGTLASDLRSLFEESSGDQEARLKFWGDAMVEAQREDLARPIALAALNTSGVKNYYSGYSQ